MRKILFLTTFLPYPLDNGGKIKTYHTLEALSKLYKIDLICYLNKKEDIKYVDHIKGLVNSVEFTQKGLIRSESFKEFALEYVKSIFKKTPYSINKFVSPILKEKIQEKLSKEDYEFIYVDHLPMMVYYKYFHHKQVILDEHNVESMIFKRMVSTSGNPVKKILGSIEYMKLHAFEKKALNESDQVICLSEIDQESLLEFGINKKKTNVLPIHFRTTKDYQYHVSEGNKLKLLFLGSMSWYPNQQGILWFLENVWGKLDKNLFELYIVGSNPPDNIKKYHNGENVIVTGYVDDVDEYIEKCDLSIVPLFVGSGQRVKIIESFAKGIPVLSTTIGAEGLNYQEDEDILIADTAEEFIDKINKINNQKEKLLQISKNSQLLFHNYYSAEKLPEKLQKIIVK